MIHKLLLLSSYPSLAWDMLPPAGASQVHPHLHVFLSPDHYYGTFEGMRSAAQRFLLATGENYFSTLLDVHAALGLVVEYGDALALSMLVRTEYMSVYLSIYLSMPIKCGLAR